MAILATIAGTAGGIWLSRPAGIPVVAPSFRFRPALDRMQETGRRIYLRRCAWCHGKERDGFGLNATKLEVPPADFTATQFRETHPKPVLIDWMEGRRPRSAPLCPVWEATLHAAEISAVADYLLSR